jgi:nicotinamidase-related amidase
MAIWDDVLQGKDREIYEALAVERKLGKRPAVVVVDVNYAFVGTTPMPLEEAIKEYRTSCGEVGWDAVPRIRELTDLAREMGIPVFYSTGSTTPFARKWGVGGVGWGQDGGAKEPKELDSEGDIEYRRKGNAIVAELGRQPQDLVLEKTGASVFLGTPLLQHLIDFGIDTVIFVGTTTSGCVRASAVEASNLNLHTAVVEDCTFDRFEISHKVSLMDLNAKYAKVMALGDTLEYLKTSAEPSIKRAAAERA